jgi:hypothetical protein
VHRLVGRASESTTLVGLILSEVLNVALENSSCLVESMSASQVVGNRMGTPTMALGSSDIDRPRQLSRLLEQQEQSTNVPRVTVTIGSFGVCISHNSGGTVPVIPVPDMSRLCNLVKFANSCGIVPPNCRFSVTNRSWSLDRLPSSVGKVPVRSTELKSRELS